MRPSFAQTPTLVGDRVVLEPLGPAHVDGMVALVADAEVGRLTGSHETFTRAQLEHHCATRSEHDDRLDYAVIERATGAFLGDLAVMDLDVSNRSCGFRIALLSTAVGQGFGTEATRLVVDHVFRTGVHRIALEVYALNPRARHVYEKVGFVHEGTLRDALWWEGRWVDAHVMSLLCGDWPRPG